MSLQGNRFARFGLHGQLTFAYVTAMLVVLAVYAATVLVVVNRSATRALEERIRADFMWAAEMYEERANGELTWFERDDLADDDLANDEDQPWLRVWSPGGDLLFQTAVARRNPLPASRTFVRTPSDTLARIDDGGMPFRVLTRAVRLGDRSVVVQVARSEASVRRDLTELGMVLAFGLPLALLAAAAGGYLLARRALAPVGRMAERARTITATRLSERLPVDNPHDELGTLAAVFNRTLERLERSFDQMRHFTADVSHELRTPLTAMRTVGEVALRHPRSAEAHAATIASMLEEADRLSTLVERLLTLSRVSAAESLRPELVDVSDLVDDVTTRLRVLADDRQQVLAVQGTPRALAVADPLLLRQALVNLVDNAMKYSPDAAHIAVAVQASGDHLTVDVIDNGPGIPLEQRERLFDRFTRGPETGGRRGHGLGLAIAQAAVEASGGALTLVDNHQPGSHFRVSLPRAADTPLPPGVVEPTGAIALASL